VDAICDGFDTLDEIFSLQTDLLRVQCRLGMEFKKWSSDTLALLERVSLEGRAGGLFSFDNLKEPETKVLGLQRSQ